MPRHCLFIRRQFGNWLIILLCLPVISAFAQDPAFSYQGRLTDGGVAANGAFDLRFILYDMPVGGAQQGPIITLEDVAVANGIFTVTLDFGAVAFPGAARWLEIGVRPGASVGVFTLLSPRQPVNSTPYALRSLSAGAADSLSVACVSCVTSGQIGSLPSGSGNYVQNTTNQQAASNFNISGNGTIGGALTASTLSGNGAALINLNAANIASGILGAPRGGTGLGSTGVAGNYLRSNGTAWTSSALQAGDIPTGSGNYVQNTINQQATSNFNISGNGTAGGTLGGNIVNATTQYNLGGSRILSVPGTGDLFVGTAAGTAHTTGTHNTFVGISAGFANNSGGNNSFFGSSAGSANTTGSNNAFFGSSAGTANTASDNAFFGANAGASNLTGNNNAFFGRSAGDSNTTGDSNSFFGEEAGFANTTSRANSFFGSNAGHSNTGNHNSFFGLDVGYNNTGGGNAFFGNFAGSNNDTGSNNSFFGWSAGRYQTTGISNSFFGRDAGLANRTGNNNTIIGTSADVGFENLDHATAIGSDAIVTSSARIQLGRDGIDTVRIGALSAATATHVCISSNNVLASCSSSQRYKQNIQPWRSGLQLIQRLRPVRFDWKEQRATDLGLIAEEVAKVEPLLVTHNKNGVIEGVKYDQLSVVLINAVKEQQQEIELLRAAKAELEQRLSALENLVQQNRSTKQARRRSAR
ncbi:MAG TPA: tail fiber domain-containing protein [Blastocatellia bacterium]|nr:tail fiber domain-containing protein [Blastocatellia bacterium]